MKKLLIFMFLTIVGNSCKKSTTYQLQIIIKNETSSVLTVKLFPKRDYTVGGMYCFSNFIRVHRDTEFQLEPNLEMAIYITNDLRAKPYLLTRQVFDSIHISTYRGMCHEIKFSPLRVMGYSKNLYSENSNWTYEIRNFDLPTNFQRNAVESHDYLFEISEDKFTK